MDENVQFAPIAIEEPAKEAGDVEKKMKKKIGNLAATGLGMTMLSVALPFFSSLGAIISIFLSFIGSGKAKKAEMLAQEYGFDANPVTTMARGVGLVGKFFSIYYTSLHVLSWLFAALRVLLVCLIVVVIFLLLTGVAGELSYVLYELLYELTYSFA